MWCLNQPVSNIIDICCRVTASAVVSFSESESDTVCDKNHFPVSKALVHVLGSQKKDLALAITQNGHRLRQEHMML